MTSSKSYFCFLCLMTSDSAWTAQACSCCQLSHSMIVVAVEALQRTAATSLLYLVLRLHASFASFTRLKSLRYSDLVLFDRLKLFISFLLSTASCLLCMLSTSAFNFLFYLNEFALRHFKLTTGQAANLATTCFLSRYPRCRTHLGWNRIGSTEREFLTEAQDLESSIHRKMSAARLQERQAFYLGYIGGGIW